MLLLMISDFAIALIYRLLRDQVFAIIKRDNHLNLRYNNEPITKQLNTQIQNILLAMIHNTSFLSSVSQNPLGFCLKYLGTFHNYK